MKPAAVFLALVALVAAFSAPARSTMVDGEVWVASSQAEKRAYLLGMSNLMTAAMAAGGTPASSPVARLHRATQRTTLDQAIARLDRWYGSNPDRRNEEVVDVLWLIFVRR